MKRTLCIILSVIFCALPLASCTEPEELPLVIVGNEDPPITLGKENSYVIYVKGKPIEAYDLRQVSDKGEEWGDPGDSEYHNPKVTPLSVLEKMTADQKGAVLRIKVNRLYQNEVFEEGVSGDKFYCYAEVTVEAVYANFSDQEIKVGDTFSTKQHHTVIQPRDGEAYLINYIGSQPLRPGFSYIYFAREAYAPRVEGEMQSISAWMADVGVFELSSKESRESFSLAWQDQFWGYLSPLATEVFQKYAPSILE